MVLSIPIKYKEFLKDLFNPYVRSEQGHRVDLTPASSVEKSKSCQNFKAFFLKEDVSSC